METRRDWEGGERRVVGGGGVSVGIEEEEGGGEVGRREGQYQK